MNTTKVAPRVAKGNAVIVEGFDHYVAVDWSEQTMAIAQMGRRLEEPVVFERSANLKSLKEYLETLRGRIVVVVEETATAQWLYLELHDAVERIVICNPHRNRLLSDDRTLTRSMPPNSACFYDLVRLFGFWTDDHVLSTQPCCPVNDFRA